MASSFMKRTLVQETANISRAALKDINWKVKVIYIHNIYFYFKILFIV